MISTSRDSIGYWRKRAINFKSLAQLLTEHGLIRPGDRLSDIEAYERHIPVIPSQQKAGVFLGLVFKEPLAPHAYKTKHADRK
jgi:hypothetical protein